MGDNPEADSPQEEEKFEMSPEEATKLDGGKPVVINRKKILIVICIFFSVFVGGGMIFNTLKQEKKTKTSTEKDLYAANSSSDFLSTLQNRALSRREPDTPQVTGKTETKNESEKEKEPLLPPASFSNSRAVDARPSSAPPPPAATPQSPPAQNSQPPTHFKSSLVPPIEGSLFSRQGQYVQPAAAATARSPAEEYFSSASANAGSANPYDRPSDYAVQNDQRNKLSFYGSSAGSGSGFFIGENSLWTGTIIPGVLETAVNTDLPGNIIARVTQNVFDSQTGRNLLVPQGTLLLARYNSSISYAQRRVQIVWDTMIRPDGFQIDLDGANGVDKAGMSGQSAKYHENWFEYLKAAGIITLFSVANAKMTETAAQYATEASAGNIAESNSAFVNQIGGNMVGRAMNIQPTLTVDNGTPVNIMLNRTLYLPPVPSYPVFQKYILE